MKYDVEIIKRSQYNISSWSGGTTTELFIYPENSKYTERNFKWRISSATVDCVVSDFTNLPGISRELMVIEGSTTLEHENHYSVHLKPFEKDSFKGEWATKSYGRVIDFNLMTTERCTGDINSLVIESNKQIKLCFIKMDSPYKSVAKYYYSPEEGFEIVVNNEHYLVDKKELFCITFPEKYELSDLYILNVPLKDNKIIETTVYY